MSFAPGRPSAWYVLVVIVLCTGLTACAKTQARTVPHMPPLAPPAPPPRVVIATPMERVAEPVNGDTKDPATPRPTTRAASPKAEPPKAESSTAPKPEPPPADTPPQVPEGPKPEEMTLKLAGSANDAQEERRINDMLTRADRDLGRVDYARLKPEGQAEYDRAKNFMQQARVALRAKNYVFAINLADKAAKLAAALLGG